MANNLKIEPLGQLQKNLLSEEDKILAIEHHFQKILEILGLDINDDSLKQTPHRFAKMLVTELFSSLGEISLPSITAQENTFKYHHPLIEANIVVQSICEHHFLPILGFCHIGYIPKEKVIGLSKLHRLVGYFTKRPQIQERMSKQITDQLSQILETPDVAVVIDAVQLCVRMRGVQDQQALTRTMDLSGAFLKEPVRSEFFASIPKLSDLKL